MAFFRDYDFERVYAKQEYAPFIPLLNPKNILDTRNFDVAFTKLRPKESVDEASKRAVEDTSKFPPGNLGADADTLVTYPGFSFSMDDHQ